jgi:hypothetical protein
MVAFMALRLGLQKVIDLTYGLREKCPKVKWKYISALGAKVGSLWPIGQGGKRGKFSNIKDLRGSERQSKTENWVHFARLPQGLDRFRVDPDAAQC